MTLFTKLALAALPLVALTACVQPEPATPAPDADACNASSLSGLVGQPSTVLKTMLLPAGTRVINPGEPVTMDFRPDRMNIEIGTDGRIAKIGCY